MVLVEKCLKSSFFNLEALRHFPQHSDNLGLTSGISAKYRLLTPDVGGGDYTIRPIPESNSTHAYQSFRSNPTLKSQISLSEVKYHSKGQKPLPGPNTTPILKYHPQGQNS